MRNRGWSIWVAASLLILLIGWTGCASGPTEEEQAAEQATEDWSWLEENKDALDAKRAELAAVQDRISGAVEALEGDETTPEDLQAQADTVSGEIQTLNETFTTRLFQYINDQGIAVGEELTPEQLNAIRMKSSEDLLVANEYIEKGGDYQRAIDIYTQAMVLDPDNEELKASLAKAETEQYMSEERFAQVNKKMTKDDVRAVLGQVNHRNKREYPERGTEGWFYRKENGGAAGVFFKERNKGQGDWEVYQADYDSVKPPTEEEGA